MNKKEVVKILAHIGLLLELIGENPFKSRAYYNAARTVESLPQDIHQLVESGELIKMKGIGKAIADKISILVKTGNLPYYEKLINTVPKGLMDILEIPGLGAKKVRIIYEKLKITTLAELEYACHENRLRDLDGFGQKSQENIIKNIELQKKYRGKFLFSVAQQQANEILSYLQKNTKLNRIEIAGSLRRKNETLKDIAIVASCLRRHREDIMDYFTQFDKCEAIIDKGKTKSSIILFTGINIDLRLVDDDEFSFAFHHLTGSTEYITAIRNLAISQGLEMNENGIFKGEQQILFTDEKDLFSKLGLQYIPPELRENMGEIEVAKQRLLPKLYDGEPFYGLFHVHTTYSDGSSTLAEIAQACRSMEFQYVGICDHSKSAFYANGLDEIRIIKQHEEIDTLNSQFKDFKIFKGIEVDILAEGVLDYSDTILKKFDFVIASIHSNFNIDRDTMTKRICNALKNPYVTMLGHPTGRLLLGRESYRVDMEEVIKTAAKYNKIIEINSNPYRLDLDWRLGKLAKTNGVKTALNPDAHSIEGLNDYIYGIGIARKGWFEKEDILNSYNTDEIAALFKS